MAKTTNMETVIQPFCKTRARAGRGAGMKFISLFSGGGLADVGARMAGFELVAANEIDKRIADVYRLNHGDHIRVGDILEQSPNDYPDCDLLHASPVCTNASIANANGEESSLDIATAEKTAE